MNVNSNEPVFYPYSVLVSTAIRIFRFFYTYAKRPPPPPPHFFVNRLKAESFSAFLQCGGSLSHIYSPKTLKRFSPDFTWLVLTTSKLRFW